MTAKEMEQVMEMLKDMQNLKKVLREYANGRNDKGALAQIVLNDTKPKFPDIQY
jgi:hypothetical protein